MGCFLVSTAAAVGVGCAKHIVKHYEKDPMGGEYKFGSEVKWSKKLSYLELTLWGGSFILAGEHMLHGEITPYAPFLTAASSKEDTVVMLKEMGTVGVAMCALLISAWAVGCFVVDFIKYRKHKKALEPKEE